MAVVSLYFHLYPDKVIYLKTKITINFNVVFVAEALNQIFVAILVFLRCMDIAAREGKKSYDEERYLAIQLVFTSSA